MTAVIWEKESVLVGGYSASLGNVISANIFELARLSNEELLGKAYYLGVRLVQFGEI